MKISEAIRQLQEIQKIHGDLPICGGYMVDDRPLEHITLIDEHGVEYANGRPAATGVFLS